MESILNLSAYRFVALDDVEGWRLRIASRAESAGLRGTILLAPEGINLFLAGPPAPARGFMRWLTAQAPFAGMAARESHSDAVPFRQLRVKVKPEIIRMNQPTIRPQVAPRAPAVAPATLARWLDAGRDDAGRELVLLDTRNAFEVDHGRFTGAHDWRLEKFSDFPAALQTHRAALVGKTVVSYCTGGIRCEKAALAMAEAGLDRVFQLDGGILGYFEAAGGRHFEGHCFVFDDRRLLTDTLTTSTVSEHSPVPATPAPCRSHGHHDHDCSSLEALTEADLC